MGEASTFGYIPTGSKALAWGFYLFYPVHLLALYWLRQLVWG